MHIPEREVARATRADDDAMPRVIVTGGPGVGKTTMLRELAGLGHHVVEESAREILCERGAQGLPPRPAPRAFAAELMRRDRARYDGSADGPAPVFFDRCLVESIAMAREAGLVSAPRAAALLAGLVFHPRVFILPPWPQIYTRDAERDHSFGHCARVHDGLVRWYAACGFDVHEVPRASPRQRAEHVLQALGVPAAAAR